MDSNSYEPLRLIRVGHGGIVERRALMRFKQAGARRAKNSHYAGILKREAKHMADWVSKQKAAGLLVKEGNESPWQPTKSIGW
jgi:hypothetical protein